MASLIDLAGKRFGKWRVIRQGGKVPGSTLWWCVCDCGYRAEVQSLSLRGGRSRSCRTCAAAARLDDITGQVFGSWTVLRRMRSGRPTMWLCRCACGAEYGVTATNLKSGQSRSCRECRVRRSRKQKGEGDVPKGFPLDLIGQRFGDWTVLERTGSNGGNKVLWLCLCACGTKSNIPTGNLRSGKSKRCRSCGNRSGVSARWTPPGG